MWKFGSSGRVGDVWWVCEVSCGSLVLLAGLVMCGGYVKCHVKFGSSGRVGDVWWVCEVSCGSSVLLAWLVMCGGYVKCHVEVWFFWQGW